MKKTMTMRTIAAAMAALTMMSAFGAAVMAAEEDTTTTETSAVDTYEEDTGDTTETSDAAPEEETDQYEGESDGEDGDSLDGKLLPSDDVKLDDVSSAENEDTAKSASDERCISFDTDGGTPIDPIVAEPGTFITAPEAPTKEGYIFMEWDAPIPETMPDTDMTITAVWMTEEEADRAFWENVIARTEEEIKNDRYVVDRPDGPYLIGDDLLATDSIVCFASSSDMDFVFEKLSDIANSLCDDIADMIPGGHTLTLPIKWLLGDLSEDYYGDGCKDYKDRMIKELEGKVDGIDSKMDTQHFEVMTRLDMMDRRLDNISGKLSETTKKIDDLAIKAEKLSSQVDTDSKWVSVMTQNTTKLTECNAVLNDMDSIMFGVDSLYNEILLTESTDKLNPQQKLVRLANLERDPRMTALNKDLGILAGYMSNSNTALTSNYFELISLYCYQGCMFNTEAEQEIKDCANVIAQEYLAGMLISLRCMQAEKAVSDFTVEDCMHLTKEWSDDWVACRKNSITLIGNGTVNGRFDTLDINSGKAIGSYSKFMHKQHDTRYVNFGKDNTVVHAYANTFKINSGKKASSEARALVKDSLDTIMNEQILDDVKINTMISYVKSAHSGMTLREYLEAAGVKGKMGDEHTYLIVGKDYTMDEEFIKPTNSTNSGAVSGYIYKFAYSKYHYTVKVVDIDDPELKVQDKELVTVREIGTMGLDQPAVFEGDAVDYMIFTGEQSEIDPWVIRTDVMRIS